MKNLVALFTVLLMVVIAVAMLYDRRGHRLHYLGEMFITSTQAHEHQPGEPSEQQRVVDFYKTWHRPKGEYSIIHRMPYCCWAEGTNQDCFPVAGTRRNDKGQEELTPDVAGLSKEVQEKYGGKWYRNIFGVTEDRQIDPRESPDGRSHICILGEEIVCHVRGWGN